MEEASSFHHQHPDMPEGGRAGWCEVMTWVLPTNSSFHEHGEQPKPLCTAPLASLPNYQPTNQPTTQPLPSVHGDPAIRVPS
jgi:hypothetical protein